MYFTKPNFSNVVQPHLRPLLLYCVIIFLVYCADNIMSYLAPIFIERQLDNTFLMGCIFATSSAVGICCDTFFPQLFSQRKFSFFIWMGISLALTFPAILLLFEHSIPTFLTAMAVWGVYFELIAFSNFIFINALMHKTHHGLSWGLINTFRSIGMLVAPILASSLLRIGDGVPLLTAIGFLVLALCVVIVFKVVFPEPDSIVQENHNAHHHVQKTTFFQELTIWRVLLRKIWPSYLFVLTMFIVESAFLTVGVLLAEDLAQTSIWGNFFIAAYIFPALCTGVLAEKFGNRFGKKKTAFVAGSVGGVLLALSAFAQTPFTLVLVVFIAAWCTSLATPSILATMQDYVHRLNGHEHDMIGLQNSAISLAYIVGPIVAGGIATFVGNAQTISILGGILFLVAGVNAIMNVRKVKLPQQEISAIH